jgi:TonB family protein
MLLYLYQLTIAWALFALFYHLFLRKETFFKMNRVFLLTAMVGSLFMPYISQTSLSGSLPALGPAMLVTLPEITIGVNTKTSLFPWGTVLLTIYVLGALIAAARLCYGLIAIGKRIWSAEKYQLEGGLTLLRSQDAEHPYSFLHWIFVPSSFNLHDANHAAMLSHEKAHARELHSLDVLLSELLCVAFWFHPMVYWYRRSLRTTHEYLADQAAAQSHSRKQYGLLLIGQVHSGFAPALAHHFFHSPIKKRLTMLTRNASAPMRRFKYAMLLPMFALVASCMSGQMTDDNMEELQSSEATVRPDEADKLPEYPGGMTELVKFLGSNIKYPKEAEEKGLEGTVFVQFVVEKDGSITNVQTVKEIGGGCGDEAARVVDSMPKWSPGEQDGKTVRCRMVLPVKFKLDDDEKKN